MTPGDASRVRSAVARRCPPQRSQAANLDELPHPRKGLASAGILVRTPGALLACLAGGRGSPLAPAFPALPPWRPWNCSLAPTVRRGSSGRLPVAAVSVISALVVQVVRLHTTQTLGAGNRTQLALYLTLAQGMWKHLICSTGSCSARTKAPVRRPEARSGCRTSSPTGPAANGRPGPLSVGRFFPALRVLLILVPLC
jgi:hypothetical protein